MQSEMLNVLLQMQTLPHGTTANFSSTGGGIPDSRPPTGETEPPHELWLRKWNEAVGTYQREQVLQGAKDELKAWRYKPKSVKVTLETREELEARIVKEGQGWSVEEIAMHCRCSTTIARKARLKAGANAKTGKLPASVTLESADQRERARELADNGMSERAIVMLTKLPKTTVRRVIGRAA